jgi:hypothetical protein
LRPKNKKDQTAFKTSCTPNTVSAGLMVSLFLNFALSYSIQTIYKEIAINTYNAVQTGPKTQFGGAKLGFVRVAYQVEIAGIVKNEPTAAAKKHTTNDTMSLTKSILNFMKQYHNGFLNLYTGKSDE